MGRVLKLFFQAAVLGSVAFVAYALFAELPPPERDVVVVLTQPASGE
ncbi:MAG: hypothetical protein AAF713_20900 [Pseudomonadota bacterium]